MDAQGALDSFLGRLTAVLVDEAQLLGRVRGDVEFIKEEMECMNSLILQLTEAQFRDHLVRAWMKQVVGLTRDCEGNVEYYIHCVGSRPGDDGVLGHLRSIVRFLQTIPARHRIATRIQELKVRTREVGDRRQRYGVTVPASHGQGNIDMNCGDVEPGREEEDLRRRTVLVNSADPLEHGIRTLTKCLSSEPETPEDGVPQPQVKVFFISGDGRGKVAMAVYHQHSSMATLFSCKAWSEEQYIQTVLADILEQISGVQLQPDQKDELTSGKGTDEDREERVMRLISKIQVHLQAKCFLIVVTNDYLGQWECKLTLDALLQAADGCLPGSTIIMTTRYSDLALSYFPHKIINTTDLYEFYRHKFCELNAYYMWDIIHEDFIEFSAFARKMLLHLLYVKPIMTAAEQDMFRNAIAKGMC